MRVIRSAFVTLFSVLLICHAAYAQDEDVYLEEILASTDSVLQWDPYRSRGTLVRGSSMLSFSVGEVVAVENLARIHRIDPPRRSEGTLVFDDDFLTLALRIFPPREQLRRIAAVFIDPGHGGRDPGAIGVHSIGGEERRLQEKDLVLDVGLRLRALLAQRYPDKEIVLSRDSDVYLTLEERTALANRIEVEPNESVIFVSLHANASLNRRASGFEVWFLPPEFRRRNLIDADEVGVNDPDLLSILNTMREEEITLESVLLARNVLSGLDGAIGAVSPNRGLREESWYVVRNAKMPSILVEIGFVTSREEFLRLEREDYLHRITEGIYTGVANFVHSFEGVGRE